MKLAHALLQALKDYGAGEIFGIPGDFALPLFRQIERINTLPLYTLSHEPAVGFAADAAGRYRGTLGVACVTYGAGALNMINPVATAYAEKSPLVVISGAPGAAERTMGLGLHHQVKHFDSQMLIMREVTCAQCVLDDPATAAAEIARVLTAARYLSRPVYIEFPRDMVEADVAEVPSFKPPIKNMAAAKEAARQALKMLETKKQPAMLLGVEIRRYGLEKKVAKLASTLGIPVLTTFMGRGILAEVGAKTAGTYLGLAGDVATRRLVERADALLMLGVILCDTNFGVSKRQIDMRTSIHAFDGAVHFEHHSYAGVILEAFVDALLAGAEKLGNAKPVTAAYPRGLKPSKRKLLPHDVATAVNDFFADHGVMPIASDMGDCLFTAMDIEHTALLAPGYYATMGTGIPFGLGLQAASGKRPLVLVGDGAFQMTGWELGNCRRLGLNPIVLLFNNTAWGMLKAFQKDTGYNDLDDWHFADHAETMGGRGTRVSTPTQLIAALEQAHNDESCFQLIEIMLPADVFSRTLTRFTDTITSKSALAAEADA
jgi:indolepyruvate decarboxylase